MLSELEGCTQQRRISTWWYLLPMYYAMANPFARDPTESNKVSLRSASQRAIRHIHFLAVDGARRYDRVLPENHVLQMRAERRHITDRRDILTRKDRL